LPTRTVNVRDVAADQRYLIAFGIHEAWYRAFRL